MLLTNEKEKLANIRERRVRHGTRGDLTAQRNWPGL
jgi:hypothetical protein